MADSVDMCCGRVYQLNKTKNQKSNVRSAQNLKIHLIFLTDLVCVDPVIFHHLLDISKELLRFWLWIFDLHVDANYFDIIEFNLIWKTFQIPSRCLYFYFWSLLFVPWSSFPFPWLYFRLFFIGSILHSHRRAEVLLILHINGSQCVYRPEAFSWLYL